jgi:hypothetical protein
MRKKKARRKKRRTRKLKYVEEDKVMLKVKTEEAEGVRRIW